MKKLCKTLLAFLFIFLMGGEFVKAGDYLTVRSTNYYWYTRQGSIEQALISVKPKGLYMEYGIYLTFSAKETGLNETDSLEINYDFTLPKGAIVTDSWLWVGDSIVQGLIIDKWTASNIYNGFVRRRWDPSILRKYGETQYNLKIFPLMVSETRKVKITFLMPVDYNRNTIISQIPTNMFRGARFKPDSLHIINYESEYFKKPSLLEFPETNFKRHFDEKFGKYIRADLPIDAINSSLHFTMEAPFQNGAFLSRYTQDGEGYYQLAFFPAENLPFDPSEKVCVLVDYDQNNSNITQDVVIQNIRSALHENLDDNDYFNLIFSKLTINMASDEWIPADSASIENVFASLDETPLANYSNLPILLANGMEFIREQGSDGNIILVANSDNFNSYSEANMLIDDLEDSYGELVPFHVVDFQNRNYNYTYIAGRTYIGSEYLFVNLTRLTTGSYNCIRQSGSFRQSLMDGFQSISGFLSSFDIYTSLQEGFCFGRFNTNIGSGTNYLNKPVQQVGKYIGNFPFNVSIDGVYQGQAFHEIISIEEDHVIELGDFSKTIWHGNNIKGLENGSQSNDVVNQIVHESIDNRVLSKYTAFLCLEPNDTVAFCKNCLDETEILPVENIDISDQYISLFPNPFTDLLKIEVSLPEEISSDDLSLEIYNIQGQKVYAFDAEKHKNKTSFILEWNGKNNAGEPMTSGHYIFVMKTGGKKFSMKILKQ